MPELSTRAIRPRWARVVAGGLLFVVPASAAFLIFAMVRAGTDEPHYTMSIVFVTLAAVVFLSMQVAVVAKPSPQGLYVRNLVNRYHFEWAEIISVRFSQDRPWAQLDLAQGEPVNVMAIQAADGAYAHARALELAAWVRTGEAPEPGS